MMTYYLYLDESSDFKETRGYPSIVAGYLLEGQGFTDKSAQRLMARVKATTPDYSAVPLEDFHAMTASSVLGLPSYIVALLRTLTEERARIVMFQNQRNNVIVDSDRTYLNVFASGVLALLQTLFVESRTDPEGCQLNILYAQRKDMAFADEDGQHIPINEDEYQRRIQERIELLLAKLPSVDRQRVKIGFFNKAKATEDASLMIADAVCFALGCERKSFSKEQRNAVDALPQLTYVVPEKPAWEHIQECFLQGRTADAILLWYGLYKDELAGHRRAFENLLVRYYEGADEFERSITEQIISQYLLQLTNRRQYTSTNKLTAALQESFFPLMEAHGIALDKMKFDLHFHRLTTATHVGNTQVSEREVDACRKLLFCLPKTYETLGYYMNYKLREVENLKNAYAFDEALDMLKNQEECLTNILDVLEDVGDLGAFQKGVTSDTLGKVYGSMMQVRAFLARRDSAQIALARRDFENSVAQFTSEMQKQREHQYCASLETFAGAYDDAITHLARAVGCDAAEPTSILVAILGATNTSAQLFSLAVYADLMDQALSDDHSLGRRLYEAWQAKSGEVNKLFPKESEDQYPRTLILWHFASACAQLNNRSAKKYYERAIRASLPNKSDFASRLPNVAATLVMEVDRVIRLDADRDTHIRDLRTHYDTFMTCNLPPAMRTWFGPWENSLRKLTSQKVSRMRDTLLGFVHGTPVI